MSEDLAFKRAQEVARRRSVAKKSCEAFIDLCIKIEDPDTEGIIVPFALWKEQREALKVIDENRLVVILKARQLGFTWLGLSYSLWNMVFKPGFVVVGLSKGEEEAKELVRRLRFQLENLPRWLIRRSDDTEGWDGPTWEAQILNIKIYHPNQPTSRFLGEAASKDSGRSFTANIILIDEWAAQNWAHEIWQAAYPTVNRPTGGKVIGISTAKPGTLFHDIWKSAPDNGFVRVFLPWWVDPRRTKEWYEATKKAAPRTFKAEYPSAAAEAFSVGVDRFFTDFDYSIHVCKHFEPPVEWTRLRAMDWGFATNHGVLWGAVDYDGRFWIYRELYNKHQTVPVVAALIHAAEEEAEERIDYSVGDTSIWNRLGSTGPSIGEQFLECGLVFAHADKDRVNGWNQIHRRLQPPAEGERPMLMISEKCENLITEMLELLQSSTNPEDCNTKMMDHLCFISGTEILTENGPRPIEDLTIGMKVWTRDGLRPVVACGPTGQYPVYRAKFSNGQELVGTGNHPIWVEGRGWTPLDKVRYGDTIVVWKKKQLSSTVLSSGAIPNPNDLRIETISNQEASISSGALSLCTGRYGSPTMDRSLRVTTSTTKTGMPQTTTFPISSACLRLSTSPITVPSLRRLGERVWIRFAHWLRNGTPARRGLHGILKTVSVPGSSGKLNSFYASSVGRSTQPNQSTEGSVFVQTTASLLGVEPQGLTTKSGSAPFVVPISSAITTQRTSPVADCVEHAYLVKRKKEKNEATVYNLSVAGTHEYFANGILVSNCDSLRYMSMARPMVPETKQAPPPWHRAGKKNTKGSWMSY